MVVLEDTKRVAFGRFEADLETGELWKAGLRIRLPAQPFKVLSALLEKPGAVVTRDELQQKLWDKDTNVDFERALSGAINKIRDALGDSAESPRYIETLPKRGYRFLASVTVIARQARPSTASANELVSPESSSAPEVTLTSLSLPAVASKPKEVQTERQATADSIESIVQPWTTRERILALVTVMSLVALGIPWLLQGPTVLPEINQLTHESPISEGPPNPENLPSLATDGDRILGTALVNGRPQLAAISSGTDEIQRVPLPQELASVSIADISRDGSRVLLLNRLTSSSEQPLWVVPTGGGSAFRVGDILAHAATWMPDGAGILYASGNDLAVAHLANRSSTRLLTLLGRAFWPRWSPDGKLLRFTMIDPTTHGSTLWELKAGNNVPHLMTGLGSDRGQVCCGVWTTDGKAFVFVKSRERGTDLWELTQGIGSKLTQLTQGPSRYFSPVTARSGHRIFFLGSDNPVGLQRFDPARHEFLSEKPFLRNATRVEYSRDATWIAWTDPDGGLWRARASDGSDRLQLTSSNIEVFSARWSPDGTRLALMAKEPGRAWSIYLLDAAGGDLKPMLNESRNAADPSWSPDGRQLVFGREPDLMGKESGSHQIYLLDVESQKYVALPNSEGLFSPRWSPDGHWIAALSLDQKKVMLFDMQKRSWTQLAVTSAADPIWSRDSNSLYVHAFLADRQPILRLIVPTGEIQTISDLSNVRSKDAENYFFSGLTPENEPLVLPRIGTSNLYSLDLDR